MDAIMNVHPLTLAIVSFASIGALNLLTWAVSWSLRLRRPASREMERWR